ncbi:probable UDP-arabinopyranose mutase 5, partial [Brassica napus]
HTLLKHLETLLLQIPSHHRQRPRAQGRPQHPTRLRRLHLLKGRVRWETLEDVWCGMCWKHVVDHLGYGVKTGLPYVWRNERGDAVESLRKKWEGKGSMKLMEKSVPFFESLKLPESAVTVEDCVVELAKAVKEQLGSGDPAFTQAADAMVNWVQLWSEVNSSG